MNVVLIGIQGSGKGELIKSLNQYMKFTLVSTGALFRQEIANKTALGKIVEPIIVKGNLPDLQTTMKVVSKAINNANGSLMFDGFPRTIEQADELDKICKIDKVIYLKLNKTIAKRRLLNRLTCTKCQFVTNNDEVKTNVCPVCNGKLDTRLDDTPASIKQRFSVFEKLTFPLISKYKKLKLLYEIDASKSKQEVVEEVLKVLK